MYGLYKKAALLPNIAFLGLVLNITVNIVLVLCLTLVLLGLLFLLF